MNQGTHRLQNEPSISYASLPRRILAWFIDSLVVTLTSFFMFSVILATLEGYHVFGHSDMSKVEYRATFFGTAALYWLWYLPSVTGWLYFAGFESSKQQATPGKRLVGIKVCDASFKPISFERASLRYISKLLSTLLLGAGYWITLFDPKKQGLHDKISGSLLISTTQHSQ